MAERWRKPVIPLELEQHSSQGIWLPDGRVHGDVVMTLESSDVDRVRAGFVCMKCLEPFEQAWPLRCPVCGAPVREKQADYFAREYGGIERLGPTTSLEEERGRIEEYRRKEEEQRSEHIRRR